MRAGIFLLFLGLLAATNATGVCAAPEQQSIRQVFLRDYPQASKRLQELYTRLRISVRTTTEDDDEGIVREWHFCANGPMLRWVGTTLSGSADLGNTYAFVVTPQHAFRFMKRNGSNDFFILRMVNQPTLQDYNGVAGSIRIRSVAATGPYAIFDMPLSEFITDETFRMKGVSELAGANGKRVKVEWECKNPKRRGWFLFSPGDWALREYEFHFTDVENKKTGKILGDVGHYGQLEYSGAHDGVPLLRKVETWRSTTAGKKYHESTTEVTDLKLGPVPEQEFTLEAFGISQTRSSSRGQIMLILIVCSVLCAVIALYLRRRASVSRP